MCKYLIVYSLKGKYVNVRGRWCIFLTKQLAYIIWWWYFCGQSHAWKHEIWRKNLFNEKSNFVNKIVVYTLLEQHTNIMSQCHKTKVIQKKQETILNFGIDKLLILYYCSSFLTLSINRFSITPKQVSHTEESLLEALQGFATQNLS